MPDTTRPRTAEEALKDVLSGTPVAQCPACATPFFRVHGPDKFMMCKRCGHIYRWEGDRARNLTAKDKEFIRSHPLKKLEIQAQAQIVKGLWG